MRSPLAGWMGGKSRLVKAIVARIPGDHVCYAEPFAGGAWALFGKDPSAVEVINDLNSDVANLYRVLQHHLDEFLRHFKWALCAREEFERLGKLEPSALTDIQRASRFYYRQKMGFGGKVVNPTFGYSAKCPPRLNLLRLEEDLSAAHLRLQRVYVESVNAHQN